MAVVDAAAAAAMVVVVMLIITVLSMIMTIVWMMITAPTVILSTTMMTTTETMTGITVLTMDSKRPCGCVADSPSGCEEAALKLHSLSRWRPDLELPVAHG